MMILRCFIVDKRITEIELRVEFFCVRLFSRSAYDFSLDCSACLSSETRERKSPIRYPSAGAKYDKLSGHSASLRRPRDKGESLPSIQSVGFTKVRKRLLVSLNDLEGPTLVESTRVTARENFVNETLKSRQL